MLELERYRDMMAKCSHCGLCQATCPVYLEDFLQTHLARARMDLIRAVLVEGSLPVTKRFRQILDRCLLCTNCSRTCPAGVLVDEIVAAARHQVYQGKRLDPVRRQLLRRFMNQRGMRGLLGKAGTVAHKMGWTPEELPAPASTSFEKRFRKRIPAKGKTRARVAYFVGCATNTLYPETGAAVVKVLTHNDIEVLIPEGQVCCGMPGLAEGDLTLVQEMVRKNVPILAGSEVDAVVTDCTSCGMMFKVKALKTLPDDDPVRPLADALAKKVWEVTDYLDRIGLSAEPPSLSESYTYHMPCHRGWTPTLDDAPRKVLGRVPGMELVEMEEPAKCCGAGGTFFIDFRELATNIRSRKLADIRQTGAKTVLTQCPACRSFLRTQLKDCQVTHPIVLLAKAYGL
jgi:glycolate dehydrogenase iron-sulfur subunit